LLFSGDKFTRHAAGACSGCGDCCSQNGPGYPLLLASQCQLFLHIFTNAILSGAGLEIDAINDGLKYNIDVVSYVNN
jgi:hypothetical protein